MAYTYPYSQKSETQKMDTTFDFTNFLAKEMKMSETPEISETNTIQDPFFKKGLLKTIIMAGNGIFEVVDSHYGFSIKNQGGDYPGLGAHYPSLANGCFVTKNPAPKLPRQAVETVIEWYRRITEKNGQEAQVVFYWNRDGQTRITDDQGQEHDLVTIPGLHVWNDHLFSYTPKQYNSAGLTQVAPQDQWYDLFNRRFGMYVETHSHNSMDAFASGTDEANSANDGFQLVFGQLNTKTPVMYSWMTMNRVLKLGMSEQDLDIIMEKHPNSTYNSVSHKVTYPIDQLSFDESLFEQWDKQVLVQPVRTYPINSRGYTTIQDLDTYYDAYEADGWVYDPQELDLDDYLYGGKSESKRKAKSRWSAYTKQEELDLVSETFIKALGDVMTEHLDTSFTQTIDLSDVMSIVQEAFLAGYRAKDSGPTFVTGHTIKKAKTALNREANKVLNTLYDTLSPDNSL